VHAADILDPMKPEKKVAYHRVNLFAYDEVDSLLASIKPSHLISLAWTTTHGAFWSSPANLDWAGSTLHLARIFREQGGVRFVGAGTCAEYDWGMPSPYSEAHSPCNPNTLYGVAKLATFRMLESYAKVIGLSLAWGRVFFLFGAGEGPKRLVPSILSNLLSGTPAICRNPGLSRDFMHVDDVARAFVALLDSPAEGAVNIASGRATAIGDLVTMLGEAVGRSDLVRLEPAANSDEPDAIVASAARLVKETGFTPSLTLEEGISQAVREFRKESETP
jgi:nucleoside-diphosphate-sugar epimerase